MPAPTPPPFVEASEVLRACPHCGNDGSGPVEEALHVVHNEHGWRDDSWTVQCDKCTATMGFSESPEDAIAAWNTRPAPDQAAPALLDALEGLLPDFTGGLDPVEPKAVQVARAAIALARTGAK